MADSLQKQKNVKLKCTVVYKRSSKLATLADLRFVVFQLRYLTALLLQTFKYSKTITSHNQNEAAFLGDKPQLKTADKSRSPYRNIMNRLIGG